jgi:hypothetical protein
MVETITQDVVAYIPSTVEKKRSISSLFFVGIIMMLVVQKDLSVFERYYLALSLSLRSIWLIMFLGAVLVFFLATLLWYLYVLLLLAWFALWWFAIQQAWAWIYDHSFVALRLLVGFWNWMLSLFVIDTTSSDPQTPSVSG